jgi:hypothetical protein
MVREFTDRIEPIDLMWLPNFSVYVKLMIDGMPQSRSAP